MITVFNFMLKNKFNIKINVIYTTTIVKKKGNRGIFAYTFFFDKNSRLDVFLIDFSLVSYQYKSEMENE